MWTKQEGERLPAAQLKPEVGLGWKLGSSGLKSGSTIHLCCPLFTLPQCIIPFVTSHSTLDQKAAAVRPCSVTGLAPVAQSRDGQIPATELLLSGARWPALINAAVFCGTAAGQTNTAGARLGPCACRTHIHGLRAVCRVLGTWWNTSGFTQWAVGSPQCGRKVSLVLIISAALFHIQPLTFVLFCATVLCRLRTNGYLPEECFLVPFGGCMQEVMGASLAQLPCEVSCY